MPAFHVFHVRTFPRTTSGDRIERVVEDSYDGEHAVVAVEVYDHPESMCDPDLQADIGPWVVGPEDEVYAYLAWAVENQGWGEDYGEVYSLRPVPAEEGGPNATFGRPVTRPDLLGH